MKKNGTIILYSLIAFAFAQGVAQTYLKVHFSISKDYLESLDPVSFVLFGSYSGILVTILAFLIISLLMFRKIYVSSLLVAVIQSLVLFVMVLFLFGYVHVNWFTDLIAGLDIYEKATKIYVYPVVIVYLTNRVDLYWLVTSAVFMACYIFFAIKGGVSKYYE